MKYNHNDKNFYNKVRKAYKRIDQLKAKLNKGIFCDKYGNSLRIGDNTNHGVIMQIKGNVAVIDGKLYEWSYLEKCDN